MRKDWSLQLEKVEQTDIMLGSFAVSMVFVDAL
jgi:hypothetical protein